MDYCTLDAASESRSKIERSEFLGVAFPVADEQEFEEALQRIRRQHYDATHHCWAFRLGHDTERSSDDGEPSGTAGAPILASLRHVDLLHAAVVVVRWYGGIKLGTGGLSRAYRGSALSALEAAAKKWVYEYRRLRLDVPFRSISELYRLIAPPEVMLVSEHFDETYWFEVDVRPRAMEALIEAARRASLTATPVEQASRLLPPGVPPGG